MTHKPSANSASWQLKARTPRKGHVDLQASAQKPDYTREMTVKAGWVTEWQAAVARGDGERVKELEGLMGTNAISELKKG